MVKQHITTILLSMLFATATLYSILPASIQNYQAPVIKQSHCQNSLQSMRCQQGQSKQSSLLKEIMVAASYLFTLLCTLFFIYVFIKKLAPVRQISRPPRLALKL